MKRTLSILAAVAFAFAAKAADDQSFYGAWWATTSADVRATKGAGAIEIQMHGVSDQAGSGLVEIEVTQNKTNFFSYTGSWTRTTNPNILTFDIAAAITPGAFQTRWKGRLNVVTGQLKGTFKNVYYAGKFQTDRL